jgi:AAHS family benzoate transporter-like MFS transporter
MFWGEIGMAKINVNKVLSEGKFNAFHWVLFICSFLIITFDGFDMVVYGSSVPLIMKYWSLKGAYAGLIGTYVLIGAGIGSLVFGRVADVIGRRRTIFMCAITFTLGMILCGISPNPIVFGIFRVITGIGIGGCMPNIVALTTEWTPARNRNVMVTAIYTGMQWGGILAAVIGMWLLPNYGWRSVYLFGGLTIFLIPFLATQLPETAPRLIITGRFGDLVKYMKKARPDFNGTERDEYEVDKGVHAAPVSDVFREGRGASAVLFIVIYFCTLYMIYGLNLWLPKLMMNAGYALGSALTFLLVLNLGCFILNIGTAALADKIGPRKMVLISYFLGFFVILAIGHKAPTMVIYVLVALAGVCTMGAHNIVHGYVATYFPPTSRSTALGLCFGLGRSGAVVGPIIGGYLIQIHASMFACFLAFAIPSIVSFFAFLFTQEKYAYTKQLIGKAAAKVAAH